MDQYSHKADINFYGELNLFFRANLRDYEFDLHLNPSANVKKYRPG